MHDLSGEHHKIMMGSSVVAEDLMALRDGQSFNSLNAQFIETVTYASGVVKRIGEYVLNTGKYMLLIKPLLEKCGDFNREKQIISMAYDQIAQSAISVQKNLNKSDIENLNETQVAGRIDASIKDLNIIMDKTQELEIIIGKIKPVLYEKIGKMTEVF